MIQKIIISNFLSIREPIEVSFEASKEKQYGDDWIVQIGNFRLLKTLLLYGSNGSGKTNILLALDFLQEVVTNIPQSVDNEFDYVPFAFDTTAKEKPTVFELYFFIGEQRYHYVLNLTPKRILYEELRIYTSGNNSKLIYSRVFQKEISKNIVKFGSSIGLSTVEKKTIQESTTGNVTVLAVYSSKNIYYEELENVKDYFRCNFFKFRNFYSDDSNIAKAIKSDFNLKIILMELLKTFHSNIIDIMVDEDVCPIPPEAKRFLMELNTSESERARIDKISSITKFTSHYVHKTELGEFTLEDNLQSAGTKNFIRQLVLFYMAIKNNWLVILDEFGAGMQARTQHLLLEFFLKMSQHSQLIFATQSLGFLDFPKMRRDSLLIISKDKIGQSKVDAHTIRNIHKNIKLRKAYIDGRFTSINPNEPDINLEKECDKYRSLIFEKGKEGLDM